MVKSATAKTQIDNGINRDLVGERQPATRARSRRPGHEAVLCVPTRTIFPNGQWHGLISSGITRVLRTIRAASEYRARHLVEDDPSQQQIIPYCVVRNPEHDTYLMTRRLQLSTERRLHHLFSLGIGGHVNPIDGKHGDPIVGGLIREWGEEVHCASPATARLIAVLNDDSSPVSQVHLGLVFLIEPQGGHATIREVDKLEGEWLSLETMRSRYLSMETWSQLVFDDLCNDAVERSERSRLVVELPAVP
jgi:predicted NUDIX family phosphoesterase